MKTEFDSTPPPPEPRIPDHELIRCIGSGAYGEVWLARSITGMMRAVKIVYRRQFKDARPFDREFTGVKNFEPVSRSHDGLVDLLHVGRNDEAGYFYYVMELADAMEAGADYEACTLQAVLAKRGQLPKDECVSLGLTLTSALAHLHEHGLIHRDIKPSNIVYVAGVPKLADIGLVAASTDSRSYVGTEGYIPREGPGTPQADIYSLGKVLYEAMTGKDRLQFPELPTATGTGDQRLNQIILKACEEDPDRRYRSAADMHADLAGTPPRRRVNRIAVATALLLCAAIPATLFALRRPVIQETRTFGYRLEGDRFMFGYRLEKDAVVFEFDPGPYRQIITGAHQSLDTGLVEVHIAGDFNRWLDNVDGQVVDGDDWKMQRVSDRKFVLKKPLEPFRAQPVWHFKFVCNRQYWADPPNLAANHEFDSQQHDNLVLTIPR